MKILIIDTCNLGLDFAIRCQHSGHKVKHFIRHTKQGFRSEVGDGIVERVSAWEPHMIWADLIFCTYHDFYIHQLEVYREKGYPIIGPSLATLKWENDRLHGEKILNQAGIKTIGSHSFTDYDEAINFVIKNPTRWVSKPIGDGAKALSYVSGSAADMVYMLQKWKKEKTYKTENGPKGFILQEFHKGIEMAVGGWFGLGGFSKWFLENWEFKKLMNGELGVATGEMGTVLRYTEDSKLANEVLKPLEDYLHALNYTGYIDVNCIIDEQGQPWPLEFTMRPGWPLFQIQQALHKGDPAEWMLAMLDGKDILKVSTKVALGVSIVIPDYPYSKLTERQVTGYPLFGLTEEDSVNDIHFYEVKKGKAPSMEKGKVVLNTPTYVTAGDEVLVVSSTGETVKQARDKCYETIKKKIEIPNSIMYRTDIGCRLEEQLPRLHKLGYCMNLEYGE